MASKRTDTKSKTAATKSKTGRAGEAPVTKGQRGKSQAAAAAKAAKAAPKVAKAPRADVKPQGPRHPSGRVKAAHGSKEALAKALASVVARTGEDAGDVEAKLKTASNAQLLRLSRVSETVKKKYGSRDALIAAIGTAQKKSKDQDFLTKLGSYSLPQLLDLAASTERRNKQPRA